MANELEVQSARGVENYRTSTDAANICKDIVVATAKQIGDRKYVQVEGWQAIAVAHGCAASSVNVERVEGGYRATGQVRRMADGALIAQAEGFVGEDEPMWFGGEITTKWGKKTLPKRADYAIRAMAQTRAISRACRSAFAHVVVMMNANLSTTPAEEVPAEGFEPEKTTKPNDAEKNAPAKGEVLPAEKPVPEGLQSDVAFAKQYSIDLGLTQTSVELEALVKKNALLFSNLKNKLPKWHERLVQIIDEQRAALEKMGGEPAGAPTGEKTKPSNNEQE